MAAAAAAAAAAAKPSKSKIWGMLHTKHQSTLERDLNEYLRWCRGGGGRGFEGLKSFSIAYG